MFKDKNIVIGICGGISAYKTVELVSRLTKEGARVSVIMTENAARFVTPLTFRAISHQPVVTDMFSDPETWDTKHISLAEKADAFVIAPATANVMGKVASGVADDMLTTTIMATKAPVLFVPAMNTNMYENPVMQQNLRLLAGYGYRVMEPDSGSLACGATGKGRFPETQRILDELSQILVPPQDLAGLKVLITAGPTLEPIDPVRFISNHSSGKMGYAIARNAAERGAKVLLISGPVALDAPEGVERISVGTAVEMHAAAMERYKDCDILVLMAAVADYRSVNAAENKIKKTEGNMTIELTKNPDIAADLGKVKGNRILVGACAETEDLLGNARKKIASKNLDLIMANDVTQEGAGFGVDTNIVQFVRKDGEPLALPLMSKREVAEKLLDQVLLLMGEGGNRGEATDD
jgi:phosphopantothenoylcysteine decarboxylase/phosphopantothenate--cysteine ligase